MSWIEIVFSSYNGPRGFHASSLRKVSMSRGASRLNLEREDGSAVTNGHFDRPRSVSFQAPRGGLYFRDSSGLLFSMYSKLVEEEDNKMVDRWLDEAKGILIFAGLFSAFVAAPLSVTIPDLKPSPQANSEFYLKIICQSLSHQNDSCQPPFPDASTFSPSGSTIWVNSLWILSAIISLTCAMLATFVQKWARRYIRITQRSQYSPHKRARLRAFFSDGVDKWHVSWTIETLPTLLHLSLFLFFVGLLIYFFSINRFVFCNVVWWVVLSVVAYLIITFLPIFRPDCPYHAPLSLPIWHLYATIRCTAFKVLSSHAVRRVHARAANRFRRRLNECYQFLEDIGKTAEDIAWKQASKIDIRVLESTFNALGEVGAQEDFFVAIPGFFESDLVNGLEEHITSEFRVKFREALSQFLERTLSLNPVSESVRSRRLLISLNAARAALSFDDVSQILLDILSGRWPELTQSVEMIQSLRQWAAENDEFRSYVHRIVAKAVVDVQKRNEGWISLVKDEFGVPDRVIRRYIAHGDSVLLSILIHITRQAFHCGFWTQPVLSSLSGFSIHNTLPGLQHAFCALWNDILFEARAREANNIYVKILREIRHVYINLHRGTDAFPTAFSGANYEFHPVLYEPRSYRFCNIASHRQTSATHTPISDSLMFPSPTQPDQLELPDDLSHPSPSGRHLTPHSSTAALESSANYAPYNHVPYHNHAPYHTQRFTLSSPTVDRVRISTQAPSISDSSVSESIGTAVTWDPNLLVPSRASLSVTAIATTRSVRLDDPMPRIHINGTGESSRSPAVSSFIFQNPDSVPTAIASTTGHDIPSCPVPVSGVVTDTLHDAASSATLSHSLEGNKQQDAVAPPVALDISEIPSTVYPVPRTTPTISPIAVSDSPSSPIILPSLPGGLAAAATPSSVESAPLQILHMPRSPSSSLTSASFPIFPQVVTVSEAQVASSIGIPGSHEDARDPNPSIPMTALPHSTQTAMPTHDVIAAGLHLEDEVQRDEDKLQP